MPCIKTCLVIASTDLHVSILSNMPQIQLAPSDTYYSQSSISHCFTCNGTKHAGKTLVETVNDILLGRCRITDIPRISVVRKGDVWVTADNRRLWVFQVLESLGQCDTVTVKVARKMCCKKNVIKKDISIRGDLGKVLYETKVRVYF